MRTHQLIILLLNIFTYQMAVAQNVPVTETPYSPAVVPVPHSYTRPTISYIRTLLPHMPVTDSAIITSPSTTVGEVRQITTYLDGLGRQLQTVEKGASPLGKDLVAPVLYDAFGREMYKYLPYIPKTGNVDDGKFKTDPFREQQDFYNDQVLNPGVNNESYFYSQSDYDNSPLDRIGKTYQPGNAYAKADGNRPRQYQYLTNIFPYDSVVIWRFSGSDIIPAYSQFYDDGKLYKNVSIDEDGNRRIEYKDMDGRTILIKEQVDSTADEGNKGWACTYYVYDDLDRLRFIIPPKAVDVFLRIYTITPAIAAELCVIYRYDDRGRVIMYKQPASDSVELIYSPQNKVIASRTGLQKSRNIWQAYFYDGLLRNTSTGYFYSVATRDQLHALIYASTYNDWSPIPGISVNSPDYHLIAYTYYDNHVYPDFLAYSPADAAKTEAGDNQYAEPLPPVMMNLPKGLVAATVRTIEGLNRKLTTRYFYDNKGRMIQSVADNIMFGWDITSYLYDFDNKLLSTYLRQTNPRRGPTFQHTLLTIYHYDAVGRLEKITKRLNDDPSLERTVAVMEYDELGRVRNKKIYADDISTYAESQDFQYDLRGQLTGINKPFVNTPNSTSNWFGQEISYERGFSNKYYNGNIAGVKWKGGADGIARAYGYSYDQMNRLVAGEFNQQNSGSSTWTHDKVDFSVSDLSYDINGNILSMKQRGMNGITIQTIDSLAYNYFENSNRLDYITDKANNPQSKLGDFRETLNAAISDFTYDADGNLSKDRNKDIDSILYDQHNRPSVIFLKRGMIYLQFDNTGDLLAKIIIDTSAQQGSTKTIHYAAGFVYEGDTLRSISHADGRIRSIYKTGQPVKYVFDAFVKDYQGSVRSVLGSNRDTAEYFATMETDRGGVENALFSNIDNTRAPLPSGYPTDNTTNPNTYVSKVNGVDGPKIGPSLVLRVMRGDTVAAIARAFYKSEGANTSGNTPASMLAALLEAFSSGGVTQGTHFSNGPGSPLATTFNSAAYQDLVNQDPSQNLPFWPKAYLSFVLFDDQFKMVDKNSGVRQVQGPPDAQLNVFIPQMIIQRSGFLYIYLSNESPENVYFDNFIVKHQSGPLLEESHYYPMGLLMEGISPKALKGATYQENKHRYKGNVLHSKEMREGPGLDWYNENSSMYDVQTGRWFSVKPLDEAGYNPYRYLVW